MGTMRLTELALKPLDTCEPSENHNIPPHPPQILPILAGKRHSDSIVNVFLQESE